MNVCFACIFGCELYTYLVPLDPEEGVQFPETGVSAAYGLPAMGARNQTYVLYKSSKCS